MGGAAELVERGVPDRSPTLDLPAPLARQIDFLAARPGRWVADQETAASVRARALALAGRVEEARAALAGFDPSTATVAELAAACWSASRAGPVVLADPLAAALTGAPAFLTDGEVPLGPRRLAEGLAVATAGRLGEAADLLRRAVEDGDRRAPLWGAVARLELGRVLLGVADVEPGGGATATAEAGAALRSARLFFAASGHDGLRRQVDALLVAPVPDAVARPAVGHLVPGPSWVVGFGVQPTVEVRPTKGLRALAHLVDHRHRPVPALELALLLDGVDPGRLRSVGDLLRHVRLDGHRPPEGLREALHDERTRWRVSKLLRRTIAGLVSVHPVLAGHLAGTVEIGHVCRYQPSPEVRWRR